MSDMAHQFEPAVLQAGECLLTLKQVQQQVPKSTATIYRWIGKGIFPRAYRIGPNSVVWRQSDISRFISENTNTPA